MDDGGKFVAEGTIKTFRIKIFKANETKFFQKIWDNRKKIFDRHNLSIFGLEERERKKRSNNDFACLVVALS